jgi:hypothetical protein
VRLYAEQGFRGTVIDLETGRRVPKVIWLDETAGELEAYRTDSDGRYVRDVNGDYETYRAKGKFKFVPQEASGCGGSAAVRVSRTSTALIGAPSCVRCRSPLTLPGDDLCPACRARDRGQKHPMRAERLASPLLDRPCQAKGCGRLAEWAVADEVGVSPEAVTRPLLLPDGRTLKRPLYERGATVGRRYYCSFHYRPPRILDAKGEVIQDLDDTKVRPQ